MPDAGLSLYVMTHTGLPLDANAAFRHETTFKTAHRVDALPATWGQGPACNEAQAGRDREFPASTMASLDEFRDQSAHPAGRLSCRSQQK